MVDEGSLVKTDTKSLYCLPCKLYYSSEFMEKYSCSCCRINGVCLAKHSKDGDQTCSICNVSGLCDDCCTYVLCCGHKMEYILKGSDCTKDEATCQICKRSGLITINTCLSCGTDKLCSNCCNLKTCCDWDY